MKTFEIQFLTFITLIIIAISSGFTGKIYKRNILNLTQAYRQSDQSLGEK